MSEHTPGPWYMHDYTELFGDDPMRICVSCDECTELTICYMGNAVYADVKEARSNAHLIAAAPEMLEALKDFYNLHESREDPEWHGSPLEQRASRAINKAKGATK